MDRAHNSHPTLLICALLGLVTLAAYSPVLRNDFVHFDDTDYVTENIHILTGLTGENITWAFCEGYASNWHPVTWLSHMLDVQLFGLNPVAHHLTSLLFHLANTLLLFAFLRRTTGAPWRSAMVAALFAVHPLHVESVAWVAERKDVLSTFFLMLTLWAYANYVESRKQKAEMGRSPSRIAHHASRITFHASRFYLLSLVFFALGLMSKSMLVTVPFLLLLLDVWPLRRNAEVRMKNAESRILPSTINSQLSTLGRLFVEKLPFFALAACSSIITFLVQHGGHATAIGLPLGPRLANAVAAYLKYVSKTLWPADLAVFYPHPDLRYPVSNQWPLWQILLVALFLVMVSAQAVVRLKREPWLATGWFWFLGTLVPVIGIVQVGGQAMADRYSYIPLIGLFIYLVWGVAELLPLGRRARLRAALGTAGLLMLALCIALTRTQVSYWRNNSTLFQHALAVTQNNPIAEYNVGTDLARANQFEQALPHFQAAVAADPTYSDAQRGLGLTLKALGKADEALAACEIAVRFRPWDAQAHSTLGVMLWLQGKKEQGMAEFAEALRLKPGLPEAYYGLGSALLSEGNFPEAAKQFAEGMRHRPKFTDAMTGLGRALAAQGKLAEAQVQLREVVRLSPTNAEAHVNLGNTLIDSGQTNEAAACFATALRLDPNLAVRKLNEGKTLLAQGQGLAAMVCFTVATRLQPESPDARETLGQFYAQQGKLEDAVREFQQQLRLRPDAQAWYNLALARVMQHDLKAAVINYEEAVKMRPDWAVALNDLAWIRATAPQADVRDGSEAVLLAERACQLSGEKEPRFFGTLDAAYAEAGKFEDAIRTAEKTRQLAVTAGDKELAAAAEQRLALYRSGKPYRQRPE